MTHEPLADQAAAEAEMQQDFKRSVSDVLAKAVARCVIAMKLGDEFECPDELGVQS